MDSHQKQKGPGTSDQSLFRLRNKFRNIPLLVMYYLIFRTIPEITFPNLCKTIHEIINYPTSICPLNLEIKERKEKNYKKMNILKTKIAFPMK